MSIIRAIKQQLGLGPAAENHFWDGSVANQLSLKRGTPDAPGATVMQVVDGKVITLTYQQAWRVFNVPAERAGDTDYTNFSGLPIDVAVTVTVNAAATPASITVDGIVVSALACAGGTNVTGTLYAKVQNGGVYRVPINAGTSIAQWREYR